MKTILLPLNMFLLATTVASAQPPKQSSTTQPAESKKIIQIQLRPAAAPQPALKYQLLPEYIEQTPGNAEPLYNTAIHLFPKSDETLGNNIEKWLQGPLQDLPREDVRQALDGCRTAMSYARLASRREWCRWDPPLRTEGIGVLLPELSYLRALGRAIALKARLEIAEGHFDAAIEDLKTGFALARHTAETPILINNLVATAIAGLMADRVQELIAAPGAPNLYWALTDLPNPFIDLREAMHFERDTLLLSMPQLRHIQNAEMSPQQWQDLLMGLGRLAEMGQADTKSPSWDDRIKATAMALKTYPQAKQYLVAHGRSQDQVDRMPVPQAILLYMTDSYTRYRDELFKWFGLPYWQVQGEMKRVERELAHEAESSAAMNPMIGLLPAISRAYLNTTKLERQIAALRCIEAIRIYAASNDGRLPASLANITVVPVPMDPMTNTPFMYESSGTSASLEGPAPAGESPKYCLRYELKLGK